jgi:zinc/manganese transport system permease protein
MHELKDILSLILPAFFISLSLILIHVYFGTKIFERGVIFADIAIAQSAFLGSSIAFLLFDNPSKELTYLFGVLSSVLFGLLISSQMKREVVFKEGFIGVIYALTSSLSIIVLSKLGRESEHIRYMLTGNILFVSWEDVIKASLIYLVIGILHIIFKMKKESFISEFFFFSTFGLVVSSSVSLAGVLLVFSYLIVPVLTSKLLFSPRYTLLTSYLIALISTIIGFTLSVVNDLPTAPTVISVCILFFFITLFIDSIKNLKKKKQKLSS